MRWPGAPESWRGAAPAQSGHGLLERGRGEVLLREEADALTEDLRGDVVPAEGGDEDNDDLRPFPPQHRGHWEVGIRRSGRTHER